MKKVGFIGWRGMVGSVLINRILQKNEFKNIKPFFFSTSQYGKKISILIKNYKKKIINAKDINTLILMDIIITCQGSEYTKKIYPKLIKNNWKGYWIDSSSYLRMNKNSIIILDPINHKIIKDKVKNEKTKLFIGGNCTVNLMLMAIGSLFKNNLIEWIYSSTYQAASGAGAKYMIELLIQMGEIYQPIEKLIKNTDIIKIDNKIQQIIKNKKITTKNFQVPLAMNLIPWIDDKHNNQRQSKEEWKMQAETNKILNNTNKNIIPMDGTCVRISSLRCHSQSLLIKLKKNIEIKNIEELINNSNKWTTVIPNEKEISIKKLSPSSVSGTLKIPVGRIRKTNIGNKYLSVFTVGDQLLWGAAEPLRRMLKILIKNT